MLNGLSHWSLHKINHALNFANKLSTKYEFGLLLYSEFDKGKNKKTSNWEKL